MTSSALADRLLERLEAGVEGDAAPFDALALELFAHQYAANAPYRTWCDGHGVRPEKIASWREIPAFPSDAFKRDLITSFPVEQAVMAQLTSGTSANPRGTILRDEAGRRLVLTANRVMTQAYLFPDALRCRILILAPSPQMAPSMGMAIGMEETRRHFGTPESAFLLGHGGIEVKALLAHLEACAHSGEPAALIGATGAFVYFFRACQAKGIRLRLPPGSRIGDGGGYRGRFGPMERAEYLEAAEAILGIPPAWCVNVLGMAESATNYFENTLRQAVLGGPPSPRRMIPPPWCRVEAVHPATLTPLPPGETGLLRFYDLANLPTVLGVLTDTLGCGDPEGGFKVLGRARVEAGRVLPFPSERTVGPLGDNRIFRFLEHYVNFSIRFKMGLVTRRPAAPEEAACPCGEAVEQLSGKTTWHEESSNESR